MQACDTIERRTAFPASRGRLGTDDA